MKPLSSITFIKNNIKKVLPSFICTLSSVFLIYLFGVLLYGSIGSFNKASVNMVKNGSIIYSNNPNKLINEKITDEIKNDSNVSDIIPLRGMNNSMNYHAVFGNAGGIQTFVLYSEDVNKALKDFNLNLIEGRIPENNAHEITLPVEFVKQFNLKLGQYINNSTNSGIHVDRDYKLVGITEGDTFVPITCDVGKIKKADAKKSGFIFFFKNHANKKLNDRIAKLKNKNVVIMDYKTTKEEMDQIASSMNFLYGALSIIILLVLCISLGNLNYIIFINRKDEFSILNAIGISKAKLRRKLFYENTITCAAGYVSGIALTILVVWLLNVAVWRPNGQSMPIIKLDSMLIALIIPCAVSLMSVLSSLKEFHKISICS